MGARITQLVRRWSKDQGGAAAVEFAMVAMVYLVLIFSALQVALIYFLDQAVQTATNTSARQMMTGQITATTHEQFRQAVCANLPQPIFSCSNLAVDSEEALNWAAMAPVVNTPVTPSYTSTTT